MKEMFSGLWSGLQNIFSTIIDWVCGGINAVFGGIAEFIFNFISGYGLKIEIPANVYDVLNEITIGVGYIIPVRALLPIPAFMITFYVLKFVFSLYQLIAGTIIKRVRLRL